MKHVVKVWGSEDWIVHCERYCGKRLTLQPGFQSSLHMHPIKDETFFVESGCCSLELEDEFGAIYRRTMLPGDRQRILPGRYHRFSLASDAGEPCVILEVSTFHSDKDVCRREESRRIE